MLLSTSRPRVSIYFAGLWLATASVDCGGTKGNELFAPLGGGGSGSPHSEIPAAGTGGSNATTPIDAGGSSERGGNTQGGGADAAGAPADHADAGGGAAAGGAEPAGASGHAGDGGSSTAGGGVGSVAGGGSVAGSGGGGSPSCERNAAEICDGIDNNCNGAIDEDACGAKCSGFVVNGKGYMACKTNTAQSKASETCAAEHMRLVWIQSAQQNSALFSALVRLGFDTGNANGGPGGADPIAIFIGASDAEQESHWRWTNGANFWLGDDTGAPVDGAYANWAVGRPNGGASENCSVMLLTSSAQGMSGQWNDSPCSELHGALCETP